MGADLDLVLMGSPTPRSITVDHGTEFQLRALEDWASRSVGAAARIALSASSCADLGRQREPTCRAGLTL